MASPHEENAVALPHAGLIAYVHTHTTQPHDYEHDPPPYNATKRSQSLLDFECNAAKDIDEESELGFWGECDADCPGTGRRGLGLSTMNRDHGGFFAFCCFWCAVTVCILGTFGAFFAVDLAFSQLGMGTGLAMWMVRGGQSQAAIEYEMSFCLASQNPQAPGPQVWRYIRSDENKNCANEVMTLRAASSEQWKLRLNDDILFGDDLPVKTGYERGDKFISVAEKVRMEEYGKDHGDDFAEEAPDTWWLTYDSEDKEKPKKSQE